MGVWIDWQSALHALVRKHQRVWLQQLSVFITSRHLVSIVLSELLLRLCDFSEYKRDCSMGNKDNCSSSSILQTILQMQSSGCGCFFFFVLYQYFLLYPGKPGLDARGETWPTATGSPCCGSSRFCYIKPWKILFPAVRRGWFCLERLSLFLPSKAFSKLSPRHPAWLWGLSQTFLRRAKQSERSVWCGAAPA